MTWTGDFAGAASLIAEVDSVAAATGSRFPPCTLLRLRALRGREAEASAAIASAIDQFGGQGTTAARAHWAAAVLYNGLARYDVSKNYAVTTRRAGGRISGELAVNWSWVDVSVPKIYTCLGNARFSARRR